MTARICQTDTGRRAPELLDVSHRVRWLVSLSLVLWLASAGHLAPAEAEVQTVDPAGLEAMLERGTVLIDVRTQTEWRDTGLVPGSVPLTFFDENGRYDVATFRAALMRHVAPDEPVAIVCARGVRSARIANLLDESLGFTRVHDVAGGIDAWKGSGRPLVPYEDGAREGQ